MKISDIKNKAENLIETGEEIKQKIEQTKSNIRSAQQRVAEAQSELARASETDENGEAVGDVGGARADLDAAMMDLEYFESEIVSEQQELSEITEQKKDTASTLEEYSRVEERNISALKQLQNKSFGSNAAAVAAAMIAQMNLAESTKEALYQSMGMNYSAKSVASSMSGEGSYFGGYSNSSVYEDVGFVKENKPGAKVSLADISQRINYIDSMRQDMEYALANNTQRESDWNTVRGRISDEYRREAESLYGLLKEKQERRTELWGEISRLHSQQGDIGLSESLEQVNAEYIALNNEIESIKSKADYAATHSDILSRGLDSQQRTTYVGVRGKTFTDIHSGMIQKQGMTVKDFEGTCGLCSCSNAMWVFGDKKTEFELVDRAVNMKPSPACYYKEIPDYLPESSKAKIRGCNGGTSVESRARILNSFGYDCKNTTDQSLSDICKQVEIGNAAIINVNHKVLNKDKKVSIMMGYSGTDHALTITGIEKDRNGNPVGLWIHDTGVCSNMGNAFYCNAKDYEVWRKTRGCAVQYVSKKEK